MSNGSITGGQKEYSFFYFHVYEKTCICIAIGIINKVCKKSRRTVTFNPGVC